MPQAKEAAPGNRFGRSGSQICVRSEGSEIVEEKRVVTSALGKGLRRRAPSRVIVETCAEAFSVAEDALELGHEVRVVPATLVRTLGVGARKTKTTRRMRGFSEKLAVGAHSVEGVAGAQDPLRYARAARGDSNQAGQQVRGWLRTYAQRLARGVSSTFAERCDSTATGTSSSFQLASKSSWSSSKRSTSSSRRQTASCVARSRASRCASC